MTIKGVSQATIAGPLLLIKQLCIIINTYA